MKAGFCFFVAECYKAGTRLVLSSLKLQTRLAGLFFTVLGPFLHGFLAIGGDFCLSLHPSGSIELGAPEIWVVEAAETDFGEWADFLLIKYPNATE